MWCILANIHRFEDHKNRNSEYVMHMPTLCVRDLDFPMKVKDIPKFEKMKNLKTTVFVLNKIFFSHEFKLPEKLSTTSRYIFV